MNSHVIFQSGLLSEEFLALVAAVRFLPRYEFSNALSNCLIIFFKLSVNSDGVVQ